QRTETAERDSAECFCERRHVRRGSSRSRATYPVPRRGTRRPARPVVARTTGTPPRRPQPRRAGGPGSPGITDPADHVVPRNSRGGVLLQVIAPTVELRPLRFRERHRLRRVAQALPELLEEAQALRGRQLRYLQGWPRHGVNIARLGVSCKPPPMPWCGACPGIGGARSRLTRQWRPRRPTEFPWGRPAPGHRADGRAPSAARLCGAPLQAIAQALPELDPRPLPLGLTQAIGHIADGKCRDLLDDWADRVGRRPASCGTSRPTARASATHTDSLSRRGRISRRCFFSTLPRCRRSLVVTSTDGHGDRPSLEPGARFSSTSIRSVTRGASRPNSRWLPWKSSSPP